MEPRYPQIQVRIRSRNPLALVAAIREELRRARAGDEEIRRFSHQALAGGGARRTLEVCRDWAEIDS